MSYQSAVAAAVAPITATPATPALRTVLVCDVVNSVHWMQANEAGAVHQWQAFVEAVKSQVIPQFGGRMVKSLGDGLMLDFEDTPACQTTHLHDIRKIVASALTSAHIPSNAPRNALHAAFAMQRIARKISIQNNFCLRMGLHHTHVTEGVDDIYGVGVNLCARIASLAGPGEIVLSVEMRDQLTDQLDADLQDMGECYLKHIDEPVRVYRAGPAGHSPILVPQSNYTAPLQAIVAVIPFAARSLAQDNQLAVGEIIADGVIGQLSRTRDLKVISRLSTSVFRNRINIGNLNAVHDIESHLGANYVLSGSYIALDKTLIVTAELSETKTNQIVWMDRLQGNIGDLLQLQSELCHRIANATHKAILDTEVQAALTKPLPTLESYSMLLAGVSMMFRSSRPEFDRSEALLSSLMERHRSNAVLPAWLAKWYVLQSVQGGSLKDGKYLRESALSLSAKATELEPDCAFAMAVNGLVRYALAGDFDKAAEKFDAAIVLNPSEGLAWLYKGMLHAFKGEGDLAVDNTLKACNLSPLDPNLYYFQALTASAHITAGKYEDAIHLAKLSLHKNYMHASTHRSLTIAQVMAGHLPEARISAKNLMQISPNLTITNYLARTPGSQYGVGKAFADALLKAGVPA